MHIRRKNDVRGGTKLERGKGAQRAEALLLSLSMKWI